MKTNKKEYILDAIAEFLVGVCYVFIVIDKNVWKRYFGIETPLYKYWWKVNSRVIQKAIDSTYGEDELECLFK